jgi:hypothetical protein
MWKGIEREGKFKGVMTLFINGKSIPAKLLRRVLNKHRDIKQIYFGAGIYSHINFEVVKEMKEWFPKLIYTVEVLDKNLHLYSKYIKQLNVNLIITLETLNLHTVKMFNKQNVQIKLQNIVHGPRNGFEKVLLITEMKNFKSVDMKKNQGKMYYGDQPI